MLASVLMDIFRIGVPAVAFILIAKFLLSLVEIPGLSSLARSI